MFSFICNFIQFVYTFVYFYSGSSDESEQGKRSRKNPPEEFEEILDGDDVPLVEEVVEGMLDDKSNGVLEVNGDNFMNTVMKMNKAQELTNGETEHEHEGDFAQNLRSQFGLTKVNKKSKKKQKVENGMGTVHVSRNLIFTVLLFF